MSGRSKGKAILVMVDGLGDLPKSFDDLRTPLQTAELPNLDLLCQHGLSGILDSVTAGLACGSDTAHMNIFGYDPRKYYRGRGAFETMGAGLEMQPGDIAFKCNFACWDETTGIVTARKADHDFEREAAILCKYLESVNLLPNFPGCKVTIQHAKEHRCVIKVSSPNLCDEISGTDPIKDHLPLLKCVPIVESVRATLTCDIVNELHKNINVALKVHSTNQDRIVNGKSLVNVILLRGPSIAISVPPFITKFHFKTALIAPTAIIAGVGKTVGMTIVKPPGATGNFDTDMLVKGQAALDTLFKDNFDMVIIHVKCTDDCGHDGDFVGKTVALERIDQMISLILNDSRMREIPNVIAITGDHSTPCSIRDHSTEPVPFVVAYTNGKILGGRLDSHFDEISCASGQLGRITGSSVIPIITNLLNEI